MGNQPLQPKKLSLHKRSNLRYDDLTEIVIVGESGSGKSSLIKKLTKDQFNFLEPKTVILDFSVFTFKKNNIEYKVRFWDLASDNKNYALNLIEKYYDFGFITFDCTSHSSFLEIPNWVEYLSRNYNKKIKILVIGTKCDLLDESQRKKILEKIDYSQKENPNIYFTLASSLSGENMDTIIDTILDQIKLT